MAGCGGMLCIAGGPVHVFTHIIHGLAQRDDAVEVRDEWFIFQEMGKKDSLLARGRGGVVSEQGAVQG